MTAKFKINTLVLENIAPAIVTVSFRHTVRRGIGMSHYSYKPIRRSHEESLKFLLKSPNNVIVLDIRSSQDTIYQ